MGVRQLGTAPSRAEDTATKGYVDSRTRLTFEVGSSGNQRRYVRLVTLRGVVATTGASVEFILSGAGDVGGQYRGTVLVHAVQRGADMITVRAWGFDVPQSADPVELYTKQIGTFDFEVWARVSDWNSAHDITVLTAARGVTIEGNGITTADPGLVHVWTATPDASASTRTEGGVTLTNLVPNPAPASTALHSASRATLSMVGDGWARMTQTTVGAGYTYPLAGATGIDQRYPAVAGDQIAVRVRVRNSWNKQIRARVAWNGYLWTGTAWTDATGEPDLLPTVAIPAGAETVLEGTVTWAGDGTHFLPLLYPYNDDLTTLTVGGTVDFRDWSVFIGPTAPTSLPVPYFTGDTPDAILVPRTIETVATEESISQTSNRMIGEVISWAGSAASAPEGWLPCDGNGYAADYYPELYALIGTTYGGYQLMPSVMEGQTPPPPMQYFNVPDLAGRAPVGLDAAQAEFNALGEKGGAKTHTLTTAEMPSHTHTQNAHSHSQGSHLHQMTRTSGAGTTISGTGIPPHNNLAAPGGQADTSASQPGIGSTTAVNQSTGGGDAHNNLQPYTVVNFLIKAKYTSAEVTPTATHTHGVAEITDLNTRLNRLATLDPYYSHGSLASVTFLDTGLSGGPYPLASGFDPVPGSQVVAMPQGDGTNYVLVGATGGRTYPLFHGPTLQSGWGNYADLVGGGYAKAGFAKNSSGVVMLKGLIRGGTTASGTVLFTLPEGFRPATQKMFLAAYDAGTGSATGGGRVDVRVDGTVRVAAGSSGWTSLDGIFFLDAATENSLTWTPIPLGAGWVNYTGGGADLTWTGAARAIDSYGRVWHRGLITRTSGTGTALWNADPVFASGAGGTIIQRIAASNTWGEIDVSANGSAVSRTGAVTFYSLDQIVYPLAGSAHQWTADKQAVFTSGWSNYITPPWSPVGAIKYPDQLVLLNGLSKHTTAAGRGTVFTLPVGARPTGTLLVPLAANASLGRIDMLPNGEIVVVTGDTLFLSFHTAYFAEG